MEVNHFFSLGCACYPSGIGNLANLRTFAGPFDWNAGSLAVVEDCLDTDFENFLDKSQYTPLQGEACGHIKYGSTYFVHKNPTQSNDYDYYCRTVKRFRKSLRSPVTRLFMAITFPINPGDRWSHNTFWKPELNRETLDRIVQKINARSRGTSYFLVWNVILGQARNISWIRDGNLIIANYSTPLTDFAIYNEDEEEKQIVVATVSSLFKLVDSPYNFSRSDL
jgi:hypothetical protein